MKAHDIRNLSKEDLARRVEELRAEYFGLQETTRLGKERNHAQLRAARRDIARHLSVLRETK